MSPLISNESHETTYCPKCDAPVLVALTFGNTGYCKECLRWDWRVEREQVITAGVVAWVRNAVKWYRSSEADVADRKERAGVLVSKDATMPTAPQPAPSEPLPTGTVTQQEADAPPVDTIPPQGVLGHGQQRGDEPHPDGMEGGRWLWWKIKRYDVPKGTVYRLLAHMWGRDSASYDDLEGASVFESAVAPQTVRSYLNKVKNALPSGFPWQLSADAVARQLTKVFADKGV